MRRKGASVSVRAELEETKTVYSSLLTTGSPPTLWSSLVWTLKVVNQCGRRFIYLFLISKVKYWRVLALQQNLNLQL